MTNLAIKKDPFLSIDKLKAEFEKKKKSFSFESIARKCLHFVPRKAMAHSLGVSTQQISQWIKGASIRNIRQIQILKEAKVFCMETRSIENEIDTFLLMAYGDLDPGFF